VLSFSRAALYAAALFTAFVFLIASSDRALAQSTTFISGIVTAEEKPVAAAAVTATGSNVTLRTQTDTQGRFTFSAVPIGTYNVDISAPAGRASLRVDLTGSGTTVTVALTHLKEIGRSAISSRPPAHGSGTDVSLSAENLTRSPANGSLPELLLQLPGAARGANGVVHINGDHGDINYIVDGVPIPQELNRSVGTEFDPNDLAFVEALEGAYPAQYGERFASVLNINTRSGNGPPGFTGDISAGSYGYADSTLGYHTNVGSGSLVAAVRNERGNRGLDPPNFDSPHNSYSNANQFLRYTLPTGANFLNVTVSRSYRTYQIPNDISGGQPANTNDNETQEDLFAAMQFRHPIGDHGSLSFGPSFKRSRIRDLGDPSNDFAYGIASNPGAPADCAQALSATGPLAGGIVTNPQPNPNVSYVNGTCGFSLFSDRTAIDVGANLDYVNRSAKHAIAFGGLYDATHVGKTYAVTLQPGNFLAPIFTPATPDAAYTVVDTAPNVGHLTAAYLQDSWHMGPDWQLDYGVRGDVFGVSSTEFNVGFSQMSPRIKLTRTFGGRNSVYAYYGRFFTPFSLENVSPLASYTLNLPLLASVAQFDLKPQRDSVYEVGGHFALGRGDLGLRVMQKNATDLIDDTQVGLTNLHQDINYQLGRIATQTAYYQLGLARAGRFSVALTHTYSVNKGCETQLLAPCFGASNDWTPADHDQRWDLASGLLLNDRHNGWFSVSGEYGSGLSAALNPGNITCGGPYGNLGGPCKRTPHITLDAEKGFGLGHGVALTVRVGNIFNDRYFVTFANAQGTHYARPRTIDMGLRFSSR
jgi:Carboxypeptidase regulatory-like domain/TonB dependent receptor/TonB-dependent Receptor Plug Domain